DTRSGTLVHRPPWVEFPAGGRSFTRLNNAAVTLPAIGSGVVVVSLTVPPRNNGIITGIANQFVGGGWTEGTAGLSWRLRADGFPIIGYDNIIASLGSTSNPSALGINPIRIFENQVIDLTARNVNILVAGQVLLGILRGKFYPLELEGGRRHDSLKKYNAN
ncbi:hypothetical protein LCGC14_3133710, partial [marine sediment metagenome]